MPKYLSDAWFDEVAAARPPAGTPEVVFEQVVTEVEGTVVRYQVLVGVGWSALTRGQSGVADATFTQDWATAAAVASGRLSTYEALAEGRIRVSGNLAVLGRYRTMLAEAASPADIDPVPAAVRATTTF